MCVCVWLGGWVRVGVGVCACVCMCVGVGVVGEEYNIMTT